MHDLVIRGAQVADGTGAPLKRADVAVDGGRIAAVAADGLAGREVVTADGLVLAPGFIDVHTHYDAQLTWDSSASPSPSLGVTTAVIGNCGFGIAPCPPAYRDLTIRNLAEVEGMSLNALRAGIDWSFESFADYLDLIARKGSALNVAALVGHSTVRTTVMGEEASTRPARDDEIARMKALVADALAAGAIGFASSTSENHVGHGGVPMPSRLAEEGEFRALAGALGEAGRGLFQITVGPKTTLPFLETLAADTGRPVVAAALFHNDLFPDRASGWLAGCREARGRGRELYAQVGCQPLAMEFTLTNAYPLNNLVVWERFKGAGAADYVREFRDPAFRQAFRDDLAAPRRGRLFYGDWRAVEVAYVARPEHAAWEGATIAEIAAETGGDPVDAFLDLALAEDLKTVYNATLVNSNEDAIEPLLRHEAGLISLSDAGAHLTYMCDAGFALRLLGHWVRERGTFDLAEGVRQLTSVPADVYRIPDRGRIAPGAWADLVLFEAGRVGVSRPKRLHDLPGGDSRLVREPEGLFGVWVNGRRVFDGKSYCGLDDPPGQVLRRFAA